MRIDRFCIALCGIALFILPSRLLADVVVTKDDMILNGKIIEEVKNKHVRLANYHGEFIIYFEEIKEIHRTIRYEDDVTLYKKMGKNVDEAMVKTNYQAGIKKLREKEKDNETVSSDSHRYRLTMSPFLLINTGEIQSVLPVSVGISLQGEMRLMAGYSFFPDRAGMSMEYFHSEKGVKMISAFRSGIGVSWDIPVKVRDYMVRINIGPSIGMGYYVARGEAEEKSGLKFHTSVSAGPEFTVHSWVITPRVRFEYIHDNASPLYGPGFSLEAGYPF